MRITLVVPCLVLLASLATAQPVYIDHRTYPADFTKIAPGDPVADRAGFVWRHDGGGWYMELATTKAPTPDTVPTDATCPPPATFNPYTASPAEVLACQPRPLLPFLAADGTRYGYAVGEVYGPKLYPTGERVIVLSVVNDVTTPRRVVTVKWLRGPKTGELAVFYEDERRFVPLRPDESR